MQDADIYQPPRLRSNEPLIAVCNGRVQVVDIRRPQRAGDTLWPRAARARSQAAPKRRRLRRDARRVDGRCSQLLQAELSP